MNTNKIINLLDNLAELCFKAFIVFQILDMFLTAISIREPFYRFLITLVNCLFIAFIIYLLKRYKENDNKLNNLFTKDNIRKEIVIYRKVYIKLAFYTSLVLLVLGFLIEYK